MWGSCTTLGGVEMLIPHLAKLMLARAEGREGRAGEEGVGAARLLARPRAGVHARPHAPQHKAFQASRAADVRICCMAALQAFSGATAFSNKHPETSKPPEPQM